MVADELRELRREFVVRARAHLDHAILFERPACHRCRLHRDVDIVQGLQRDPARAGGAHPPLCVVVAEDDRPMHPGEVADRARQARVELGPVGGLVALREDVDEQVDRRDRGGGTLVISAVAVCVHVHDPLASAV